MPTYSTYKPSGVSSLTAGTGTNVSSTTGNVTIWVSDQGFPGGQTTVYAGTDTAVSSSTGILTIWNTSTLQSVTSRGSLTDNSINILNQTNSVSTVTGALTVAGGVGIEKDLYVGGKAVINGAEAVTTSSISQYLLPVGYVFSAGTDTAISTSSGIVNIWNTSTLESVTSRGATTPDQISITNNTPAISTATGALTIVGGLGVGGSIYGIEIYENGNRVVTTATAQAFGVSYIAAGTDISVNTNTGVVTVSNTSTLQSVTSRGASSNSAISFLNLTNSLSTTTGALIISGGVGVGKNLYVGGLVKSNDITATNIVTINVDAINGFIDNLSVISIDSAGTINATSVNGYTADFDILEVSTATFSSTATFLKPIVFQRTMLDTFITTVTNTATVLIGSFSIKNYRSCKALVQIEDPGVNYQLQEIVMIIDHTGAIYQSEYGIINTGPQESGVFSADFNNSFVRLFFTANSNSTKTITVTKTSLPRSDFSGVN